MRAHHLSCGTFCPASPRFVLGRGPWRGRARMVCHCLLVESRSGLVLVDTGLGTRDVEDPARLGRSFVARNRPALDVRETALARIEAMGLAARDVRHLVPTHLDLDHVGGISDFVDAEVHVLAAELEAAMDPAHRARRHGYRPVQWAHGPKWRTRVVAGERWMGFDAVTAIPGTDDEILLVPLTGHSAGHCGVAVRTDDGWLLHAGDAYFDRAEIDPERPSRGVGIALFQWLRSHDDLARRRNQERLRALVRDRGHEVQVISAHCADELDRYTHAVGAAIPTRRTA